jgi:plasmid maintenance system antidote protein VapI
MDGTGGDAANGDGQAFISAERDAETDRGASDRPFEPAWTLRPGVLLVNAFTERGMTAETFAESSGLTCQTVVGLIDGTARVNAGIAEAIAAALGTSANMWLNAQDIYDSDIARGAQDVSCKHLGAGEES